MLYRLPGKTLFSPIPYLVCPVLPIKQGSASNAQSSVREAICLVNLLMSSLWWAEGQPLGMPFPQDPDYSWFLAASSGTSVSSGGSALDGKGPIYQEGHRNQL